MTLLKKMSDGLKAGVTLGKSLGIKKKLQSGHAEQSPDVIEKIKHKLELQKALQVMILK